MKFDSRVSRLAVRPPHRSDWSPEDARRVRIVEAIAMICLGLYFAAGLLAVFLF